MNRLGHEIMQEPQPLGRGLLAEKIDAGRVAAGPGKAGDETNLDRIVAYPEDDRDRRSRRFGRERSRGSVGRGDDSYAAVRPARSPTARITSSTAARCFPPSARTPRFS
jgi:hypothetical protein